ncbi:septal ring lytic transglycosylase RlpA family protein [Halioglobus sp. Uisw_031]|uniref:septal ring lytic transglycosylase RlpA family protein n=1 Tax=Halioglobus sp. Uisw_031 TaxID=3230977 RepID=UPI0039E78982
MSLHPSIAAFVGLPFFLAACSTPPLSQSPPLPQDNADVSVSERYHVEQDSAPLRPISQGEVFDAIPQADPILRFGNVSPYVIDGVTYHVLEDYRDYREQGTASWYGAKFSGHKTSNGELYDLYQPSAAHKTLPIPSYARVTNLDNGKSIVVRVNDRGPFHSDRIIDLSYAAAVKLGYMEQGTAQVEVEVMEVVGVEDRRDPLYGNYRYLQLGAFGREASAQTLVEALKPLLTAEVFVSAVESDGTLLYRVRVGPVDDKSHLLAVQQQLLDSGYDAGQPLP